jgi:GNAT superfamily N-acetyltransferase
MSTEIISVTDNNKHLLLLPSCVSVHCQLRSTLNRFINSPHDYAAYIDQLYQSNNLRMCLFVRQEESNTKVIAIASYGRHLHVTNLMILDIFDIIVDKKERNQGLGTQLFRYLIDKAKHIGAIYMMLRCNLTDTTAQRFFFRQGMTITSFGFSTNQLKPLASAPEIQVIDITDLPDEQNYHWLSRAQVVHRQLHPVLSTDQQNYIDQIRIICQSNPTRILLAVNKDNQSGVLGLAAYRIFDNIQYKKHLNCDNLITDETKRSLGVGRCLINAIKDAARAANADCIRLGSGCERSRAHKFYYREGFIIDQFEFVLSL